MKKIFFALLASAAMLMQGCSGPMGPIGPQGPQGEPGYNFLGEVFEVEVKLFNQQNDYRAFFDFNKPIYNSDKIVGFVLVGQDGNKNDIWEPLPQTFFVNGNTFLYSFDFTVNDFSIFLDGNANPGLVPLEKRSNQIFRMVVIPAEMAKTVNVLNYNDVVQKLRISDSDFKNQSISIVE